MCRVILDQMLYHWYYAFKLQPKQEFYVKQHAYHFLVLQETKKKMVVSPEDKDVECMEQGTFVCICWQLSVDGSTDE